MQEYDWPIVRSALSKISHHSLEIYNPLESSSWNFFLLTRSWVLKNPDVMVSSRWYGHAFAVAPPDIHHESTYASCLDMRLILAESSELPDVLDIVMHDGDMLNGHRIQQRCLWRLNATKMPKLLEDRAAYKGIQALQSEAAVRADKEEQARYKAVVDRHFKTLIGG